MIAAPQEPAVLRGPAYADALVSLLDSASQTLELCTYVLRSPGPKAAAAARLVWHALRTAPARGVICRAVIDASSISVRNARRNGQAVAALVADGWHIRRTPPTRLMHAKLAIADRHQAILGSHNLSTAALTRDEEVSVALYSPREASQLYAYWSQLWQSSAA